MGCSSSTNTAVQPLTPGEASGDEDDKGTKLDGCGDSAVSKGTTDSGVVMENKEIPPLPGTVPRKLPPLSSQCVRETSPGLLQQESTAQERQKSSEILEELLNQGIIPVGQTRERRSGQGEAFNIMLNDMEVIRRRPPARLESLKAKKAQTLPSREDIEEKIRLAEERRKLKEDELKMRLRTKSARVRVHGLIPRAEEVQDTLIPVEPLQSPLSPDLLHPPLHSHITCKADEGGECVREAGGDGEECKKEMGKAEKKEGGAKVGSTGDNREESAERVSENGEEEEEEEEEELNQVEELQVGQLLAASGELESDSTFQHSEDKEETF
ncbi:stathmin domain-containing protein 1 [Mastacembelus armatus]|uniref:stathmin domain-containing protein 1 n=1 Tax=Mastacembelus armatus TaxID=205130 RepID=UPI000E45D37D|nr:stathmin domain-containing protein 1 [Mastacembelus armatus]